MYVSPFEIDRAIILRRGEYLSLQAESHPIEFRKVEIMPLDE